MILEIASLSYLATLGISNWKKPNGKHLSGSGERAKKKKEDRR